MINIEEKKEKIISFLESSGPLLPVRIAKVIEMEPMFASAILSELFSEKRIKMSNMKVGSSQLYFLPGQEQKLEEHTDNLNSIEKEAYLKLKEKGILEDKKEEPAIRVALRNLKDFAISFYQSEKLMWKYTFLNDEEVENLLNPKKETKIFKEHKKETKEEVEEKLEDIFGRKTKSEFFKEVEEFLDKKSIKIIEEIQENKKEVVSKVNLKTSIGDINFLLIAKNKKTINKDEINTAVQRANYYKMPCLLIIKKEASRTIQNYIKGNNLIKINSM